MKNPQNLFLLFMPLIAFSASAATVKEFAGIELGRSFTEIRKVLISKGFIHLVNLDSNEIDGKAASEAEVQAFRKRIGSDPKIEASPCYMQKHPSDVPPEKKILLKVWCPYKSQSKSAIREFYLDFYKKQLFMADFAFNPPSSLDSMKGILGKFGTPNDDNAPLEEVDAYLDSGISKNACLRSRDCKLNGWVEFASDGEKYATVLFKGKALSDGIAVMLRLRDGKIFKSVVEDLNGKKENQKKTKELGF